MPLELTKNETATLIDLLVDPVNGLGYNVFRYNIGGGENPAHEHMGQFREIAGFEPSAGALLDRTSFAVASGA